MMKFNHGDIFSRWFNETPLSALIFKRKAIDYVVDFPAIAVW